MDLTPGKPSRPTLLASDFLSYDYRLETPEESIFGCECSSINCRGTLAISHIVFNKIRKI